MRWFHAFLFWAPASLAILNNPKLRQPRLTERLLDPRQYAAAGERPLEARQTQPLFLNDQTRKFAVNGTGIPNVDFDVGESYAGLLPIGDANDTNKLYFWFYPSTNPSASKEITLWITGGPGCSSTGELMQENGPFLWQPGVFRPIANKWSWHRLTNMVWIDQPVGSGFSQGTVTAKDEFEVAKQFLGFWKNFIETFSMQGYKVYVTGSSYSGMYSPYIASAMLDANDKTYYNLSGMMLFDGLFAVDQVAETIPVAQFVETWKDVFAFNDSFTQSIRTTADQCGYTDYMRKYLTFPPAGVQPSILPGMINETTIKPECDLFTNVFLAANELNPCFSVYSIFNKCPVKFDPLGFSDGSNFMPAGSGPVFFDRSDVKAAINAPNQTWAFCTNEPVFVDGLDNSLLGGPASQPVLPKVIDGTKNVIIGHGSQDFVLFADGTLLALQNITWGGMMGFQARPLDPLYVPAHVNDDVTTFAGSGVVGTSHSERGLTYFGAAATGHFLTQDAPALAYRGMEILLGRIENFQSMKPFTTDTNQTVQPDVALGNGTVFVGFVSDSLGGPLASNAGSGAITETVNGGERARGTIELALALLAPALACLAILV
ncbi:serine carboxypeptidase [Thozetella sp. PMI_491]|nr:serine carboxypeptidase [Thozetella sp. PMI_491]